MSSSFATKTMNPPLHLYMNQLIASDERLRTAEIVADNARSPGSARRIRPVEAPSAQSVALHSLPSLTSESKFSRWDACLTKTHTLSPPPRRPVRCKLDMRDFPQTTLRQLAVTHYHGDKAPKNPIQQTMEDVLAEMLRPPLSTSTTGMVKVEDILSKALDECCDFEATLNGEELVRNSQSGVAA